jgi:hypothetical protein
MPSGELAKNKMQRGVGKSSKMILSYANEFLVKAFEHSIRMKNRVGGIFSSYFAI